MASLGRPSGWDELPDEILLQILDYLEPYSVTRLQLVSRKLQKVCLDDELWKRHCFDGSSWYQGLLSRRDNRPLKINPRPAENNDAEHPPPIPSEPEAAGAPTPAEQAVPNAELNEARRRQFRRLQDMANWDPAFSDERVSWYDEYIQRNGPTCVNWLQVPRMRDRGIQAQIEARGMAIYNPYEGDDGLGTMLAVSPLDDGSVCLWDVNGSRGKQGGIVAQSQPGILFLDGPGGQNSRRSKKIDTGVTECVSVNNSGNRAFFAVQGHLIEVDLNRLDVVSRESFEWSITTLSSVHEGVPLTVGTSLGIHLHDFRARASLHRDMGERLDGSQWDESDVFKSIFDPNPLPPYASLSQPTPISILHLPRMGSHSLVSDDIYVSGRFSNILHYDRRKFPHIVGSIYSGAMIKSLAALPYPFSSLDNEVRRDGCFTAERVSSIKAGEGRTLIAGGGYKTKGSLEIYGLSCTDESPGREMLQNSTMKNRQTAASSTILSVTNHGTKIVCSDGSGLLKWFERDGWTEVKRLRIGHSDADEPSSLFASMPASGDLARKVLSTRSKEGQDRPNNDNILFWTGDKLGMVSFTTAPLYDAHDFEEVSEEVRAEEKERQQYSDRMRQALQHQANEVRFVGGLGLGKAA